MWRVPDSVAHLPMENGEGFVILGVDQELPTVLTGSGADIWDRVLASTTDEEVFAAWDHYQDRPPETPELISGFLASLRDAGLLVWTPDETSTSS